MSEMISQYGQMLLDVLAVVAAVVAFIAGHYVGVNTGFHAAATTDSSSANDALPLTDKIAPETQALNTAPGGLVSASTPREVVGSRVDNPASFSPDHAVDNAASLQKVADTAVSIDPDGALELHQALTESLTAAGHLSAPVGGLNVVPAGDTAEHSVLIGGGSVVSEEKIEAIPQEAESVDIPKLGSAVPKTGIDAEVEKAHKALDTAGVYGPARLVAIAAVRQGQVTGDDVARAHPVALVPQQMNPVLAAE